MTRARYKMTPEEFDEHLTCVCGKFEYYMVSNVVWREAGLRPDVCVCTSCLSIRLGRPLRLEDFLNIPVNFDLITAWTVSIVLSYVMEYGR